MPELPEVETVVRQLREKLPGRIVAEVRLSGLRLRKPVDAALPEKLRGREVRGVSRRGKYIVIGLEPQSFLLIHLGMTGSAVFRDAGGGDGGGRHVHAVLRFADGAALEYRDPRRFGLLGFHEVASAEDIPEVAALGEEPLGRGFTGARLAAWLEGGKRDVKSFLLDQRLVAGLGNIYVCEALFLAGIHPGRRCGQVRRDEATALAAAVRRVLRAAIENRGTSFSDYRDADGRRGGNQRFLKVFHREGEPCPRCGASIRRMRQGGRSSFFCPACQRR
ncbi:MAG: bifunctional DNA-formamidopyrimidine glycosylase/DNA-(apurinic or apyrimidinic site) lyase [Acidobacteriota bacterium]|jgi:formamidopyrimidine-DNA glycosylase|nr:bifunctional DNA-formamidopyrimidine glycosylase/DNA-(apurinic or apyrimidinic site) lyase [Acidobacteriota bacterium]